MVLPRSRRSRVAWQSASRIEEDGDDLVIRIPKSLARRDDVERILDWMEFEELASRSQLAPEAAARLAAEVKHAVWEAIRHRVEGP